MVRNASELIRTLPLQGIDPSHIQIEHSLDKNIHRFPDVKFP